MHRFRLPLVSTQPVRLQNIVIPTSLNTMSCEDTLKVHLRLGLYVLHPRVSQIEPKYSIRGEKLQFD